jgi:hypothetical protein
MAASTASLGLIAAQMFGAEIKTAALVSAIWLTAADITQPAVNLGTAPRKIAKGWDAIANVPFPIGVISDRPAHLIPFSAT